jgi:hypothetical protein
VIEGVDEQLFANVNTPEDWQNLLKNQ